MINNWFVLYYQMLTGTGIFGIILILVTLIGLFSLVLPFLYGDDNRLNKNVKNSVSNILSAIIGTVISMILLGATIDKLPIDVFTKYKSAFEIGYFFIGMLPFLIAPCLTLHYCKWINPNYNKVK
jgi:hypothetical protein